MAAGVSRFHANPATFGAAASSPANAVAPLVASNGGEDAAAPLQPDTQAISPFFVDGVEATCSAEECSRQARMVATADAADHDLEDFLNAALADLAPEFDG